jgi:putative nucleotidyltransferase with HDIG domain
MRRYSAGTSDDAYKTCWEHSLACATVSEELADLYYVAKEDAYTAGLLHDIGRIGLLKAYSREYLPVLRAEYHTFNESLVVEEHVVKTNHCHSGSFLEKVWAFPAVLQIVAESHHTAEDVNEPRLATLIRVACAITEALGFPEVNCTNRPGIDSAALLLKSAAGDNFTRRLSATKEQIDKKLAYFR